MLNTEKEKVRYYEFNEHEYYALIAVKNDKPSHTYNKTYQLYLDFFGGENLAEVKLEGRPTEITRDQALLKFLTASGNEDQEVDKLVNDFNECEDVPLLIDGSLL